MDKKVSAEDFASALEELIEEGVGEIVEEFIEEVVTGEGPEE